MHSYTYEFEKYRRETPNLHTLKKKLTLDRRSKYPIPPDARRRWNSFFRPRHATVVALIKNASRDDGQTSASFNSPFSLLFSV